MTTITAPTKRRRADKPAVRMPRPLADRPDSARTAGAFDDRAHYVPVAHRLRLLRLQAGVDQRQLARLTAETAAAEVAAAKAEGRTPRWTKGLSAYSINRYEAGFHNPVASNVALLAATLSRALSAVEHQLVVVTPAALQVHDLQGLKTYLLGIKGNRPAVDFWGELGITPQRAEALLDHKARWTVDELAAVALAFPEGALLVVDVLIALGRKRRGLPALRARSTATTPPVAAAS